MINRTEPPLRIVPTEEAIGVAHDMLVDACKESAESMSPAARIVVSYITSLGQADSRVRPLAEAMMDVLMAYGPSVLSGMIIGNTFNLTKISPEVNESVRMVQSFDFLPLIRTFVS